MAERGAVRRWAVAVSALMLLSAAACGGGGGGAGGEAPREIRIGLIPWDEDIAITNLWEVLLEDRGYEVTQVQLEVGGLYSGVANGDLDLFMDAWLPKTHEDYWAQFGSQIEKVKEWFPEAPLTWVVPKYVAEVDSIEDLAGNADMFGGQIVGIEAGSGLMRISREEVMPSYGLDDEYKLLEGSTPAMLAELQKAIESKEPILVTLWQPHWAYGKWPLKNLADPKGALGKPDGAWIVGREGFSEDFAEVASWLQSFTLTNDQLASLELMIQDAGEGKEKQAAAKWAEQNRALVDSWLKG
jgi:glycine betaine/proline transport system substrate-binding protein